MTFISTASFFSTSLFEVKIHLCNVHIFSCFLSLVSEATEKVVVSGIECGTYKTKFSHKEHEFGSESQNTTFYVYVYDFTTPFSLQVMQKIALFVFCGFKNFV